ncbi:SPOSA6832_04337 [Sporobolomyces salmonicolor]|uniref:SPOSA6832_04337-mRNA-1:cds n=1 Tax=Sporidiobolus salmonicolor TaxID=5005 RepID=A0A0D6ERD2_SPOSA|nr:SPOSA6832_04337 [Sporobolomyces salmonicolor]
MRERSGIAPARFPVFHCPLSLEHNPPHEVLSGRLQPYFESPERYVRILDGLLSPEDGEGAVFDEIKLDWKPEEVEMEELRYAIEAVHDGDYLTFLREIYDEWVAEGGSKDAVLPETFVRSDMLLEPTRLPRNVNQSAIARTGKLSPGTKLDRGLGSRHSPALESHSRRRRDSRAILLCEALLHFGAPLFLPSFSVAHRLIVFAVRDSRPPGHHAGPALCGGYCYLNSLAIALRYYQAHRSTASVPKVAILDIDYHHGNGTSKVFYDDPSVLYVSLHGSPDYPYYTGASSERGGPSAPGTNLNYPLPLGTDNATYLRTLTMAGQAIKSFDAEVLFVSLGVDTFIDDPLTDFHITLEAYPQIGALIASLGLRTLFVLEGGYCLPAIGACVRGVLEGFVASRAAAT